MFTGQVLDIASMMKRALNTLDYRLVDHGASVAYIMYSMFKNSKEYTETQLVKICYISLFHDIGAYKTEDLDSISDANNIYKFEVGQTLNHSIYSYLFIKDYDFFKEFADIALFHHFFYDKLLKTDCKNKDLASAIFIADRLDMLILKKMVTTPESAFKYLENAVFNQVYVDKLRELEASDSVISKAIARTNTEELNNFLNLKNPSVERTSALVHMLPRTIDFRSEYTVTHTVATVKISVMIGQMFHLDQENLEKIYLGALLHDIGKISTSQSVLEKDSRLNDFEFNIIKDHVVLSENILEGCVSEDVLRIAARHHEKLDGTGYPRGLTGDDLTLPERIVAVGDILSALMGRRSYKQPFPKEEVIEIISKSAAEGKLCSKVVDQVLIHYDELHKSVEKVSQEASNRYTVIENEWCTLYDKYRAY